MNSVDLMNQYYCIIGLNVAYYRRLRGLTQQQLAANIGISRTHLSNIEAVNMPTSVSMEVLLVIAKELEVPAHKLLVRPEDQQI